MKFDSYDKLGFNIFIFKQIMSIYLGMISLNKAENDVLKY